MTTEGDEKDASTDPTRPLNIATQAENLPDQSFSNPQNLENYDWEQLQEVFSQVMAEHTQAEQVMQEQVARLMEVFVAWSQVTVSRDEDRAFKRFKTRMQHVQGSEMKLEEKKKHYSNVVKAFESALALLRD